MAIADILDIAMFATACLFLLAGFPVAFTLAGTALIFAILGAALGVFDLSFLGAFPQRIFGTMTNETLIAVPLFVFMGVMLERSRVAEELLENMGRLFGTMRGGLGISVTLVGALLAASTGIVGATVVTMGLLSLPTMLKRGYDPALATGSIAAAGTLGQIIPPSIVLVLLGDVMSSAYQNAQLSMGNFSPDALSVGDLFAGALLPGLMLVGLYIAYQLVMAIVKPTSSPAMELEPGETRPGLGVILQALVPPILLIVAVLGSILAGIATPTEAAAVGAVGATLLAGYREPQPVLASEDHGTTRRLTLRVLGAVHMRGLLPPTLAALALAGLFVLTALYDLRLGLETVPEGTEVARITAFILCTVIAWGLLVCLLRTLANNCLTQVVRTTTEITSMVFVILVGAALFSLVFRGLGGDDTVHEFLNAMPGGVVGAMIIVMAVMFFLGFFLDFIEITFVVVPVVAPVLLMMGVDPVWLGVMMAINLQTSFLTPPFGFALFYLRGVAPPEVKTTHIYKGALPFVAIQLLALIILSLFPEIATWLPETVFG
ncbi:TRAP transporter large permease subunit [Pyruvatibacter mobilis]|uniref:TRAP transporter large permease subunit n=1 Tax=Pyruvatibacter mobilis TaxID=1712261 RepID=A0A845QC75_9HYPH|nr:TRAP transporter large permease subunit [Pyruvatibacter mobilis]NBG95806.1 TRAP transporter large permease subunit [Pyruvatibacter mobilis]QJD74948.1 TRAP transporter large permease subunit [Pyruvatibacter mobilis]GGD11427.1 C4-dicarboxylate ABC transporter [Pyruvatibacter mobilis]